MQIVVGKICNEYLIITSNGYFYVNNKYQYFF